MTAHRVLCVDPDDDEREGTVQRLQSELDDLDTAVETAGSLAAAEAALSQDTAAVVTEYDLPDGTGFDLIKTTRDAAPDASVVLYTDTDPDGIDTSALRGAITEYVGKESLFGSDRLSQLVRTTIETRSQASYPLPQSETERVAMLQSYDLDAPGLMASLDRVTGLAADHYDVDQASINIINEHSQDFLSCYGAAGDWESMDREDSICTFTILEDEHVMAVEDVTEDPRFASRSDTLVDMGIRSYLGANLVTSSGLVIGPLCVYDDRPREFTDAEKTYLTELAALAMELIELHNDVAETTAGGAR